MTNTKTPLPLSLLGSIAALVIAPTVSFAADALPKTGTFTGVYGWYGAAGETVQVDKDHAVWGGVSTGSFRNDAGNGFIHASVVKCTFSGEFRKDAVTHNNGDCVVIDKDGDKASLVWKCTTCPGTGEFQWTGGSGKYAGITGGGMYFQNDAGPPGAMAGWSVWKGEWKLP